MQIGFDSAENEPAKKRCQVLRIAKVRGLVLELSRMQSGTVARVEKDLAHLDRLASVAAQLTGGGLLRSH